MLPVFSALVGSMFLEPTLALHLSQVSKLDGGKEGGAVEEIMNRAGLYL